MRIHDLFESPIADMGSYGELSDGPFQHYEPSDHKLQTSPKGVEKIINAFAKTRHLFNLYVVFPTVRDNLRGKTSAIASNLTKDEVNTILGRETDTEGKITCVYFNNVRGQNHRPLNAWTMAHRIGHAIQVGFNDNKRNLYYEEIHHAIARVLSAVHDDDIKARPGFFGVDFTGRSWDMRHRWLDTAMKLMTMKSARDGTLNNVNLEMFCELMAQYLISGRIRFNRIEDHEDVCAQAEEDINREMNLLLDSLVGEIIGF